MGRKGEGGGETERGWGVVRIVGVRGVHRGRGGGRRTGGTERAGGGRGKINLRGK